MSYQVFARKWRPTRFDQVVGQEHVLRALRNALDRGVVHHAFLFTGTRGVGKTTLARIMARCLNCEKGPSSTPCGECTVCQEIDKGCHVDLIEVDAASRARVEETRELMDNVSYAPISGRHRIYLIDEVHMFSNHSFNALLKVLEEPPDHVRFLLATTEPRRVPVTVLSRCIQFHLRALGLGEISRHVQHVLAEEKIPCEPDAADLVAAAAAGSLRDALSLLEQAIADGEGELNADKVRAMIGTIPGTDLQALMHAVVTGDGAALLDSLKRVAARQPDFSMVLSDLMTMLQRAAIGHLSDQASGESSDNPAQALSPEEIQLLYQIALYGQRDLKFAPDPGSGFEMCLIRMLAFKPAGRETMQTSAGPSSAMPSTAGSAAVHGAAPVAAAVTPGNRAPVQDDRSARPSDAAVTPRNRAPARNDRSAARPAAAAVTPENRAPAQDDRSPVASADAPLSPMPDYWTEWVQQAELSGMVRQLAYSCAVGSYDNGVLLLFLPPSHQSLLSQSEELQAALLPLTRPDLQLRIETRDHPTPTLAQWAERERGVRLDQARQQLDNDPNIRAMQDQFGAVIQPGSIKVEETSRLQGNDGADSSAVEPDA